MMLPFICDACVHKHPDEYTCGAFPQGIPLEPEDYPLHDEIIPGQVGTMTYDRDPENLDSEIIEEYVRRETRSG